MSEINGKPLQTRHWLLGGGLALALAATMWAAQTEPDDQAGAQAVAGDRRANGAAAVGATASTRSKDGAEEVPVVTDWSPVQRQAWAPVTPAQLAAWSPPPPPAAPPAPPPAPQVAAAPMAPPFPYQLIGRMEEGSIGKPQAVAFLSGPQRSLGVRTGEVIDGQWRVDEITPFGLSLTWLPSKLKQTIAFRPAS